MAYQTERPRPGRARARYAQNFFRDATAARRLVDAANLAGGDCVYDLGAGTGMITRELAARNVRVVAVERDSNLAKRLRERFKDRDVTVVEQSLTDVRFETPFKVVSNIPFNLTAVTLKRLLLSEPAPQEALIVLQLGAAMKYAGVPRETEVSLKAKPWFDLEVDQRFNRTDFVPVPGVDVGLLHARLRPAPLIDVSRRQDWRDFIGYAFGRYKPNLRLVLKPIFSNLQWKRLANDLGFDVEATPTELSFEDWLGLFAFFGQQVSPQRRALVRSRS